MPARSEDLLARDTSIRFDDANSVQAWVDQLEPGNNDWESAVLLGMYAELHYGHQRTQAQQLFDRFLDGSTPISRALDLGCGVGRSSVELTIRFGSDVVGLDSWPLALRFAEAAAHHPEVYVPRLEASNRLTVASIAIAHADPADRVRWVCANVHQPPLEAGVYDLVVALNLFDTVANPSLALGQASALLRPGGQLLIAQPDAWSPQATPANSWLSSESDDWQQLLDAYNLKTVDSEDGFAWTLQRTRRTSFNYVSHARLMELRPQA